MTKGKKIAVSVFVAAIAVIALILVFTSFYTVNEDEYGIVRRFGKVVDVKTEAGLYMKIPFAEEASALPKNKRMYDIPPSDVLTMDKKALVVDNYVVWRITDPLTFVQRVGTVEEMEKRIDAATYSVVKNTMGTKNQTDIISTGVDGRNAFNELITGDVNNQLNQEYGVEILLVEVKKLDLPSDNEAAVYSRMISDRQQIAAAYKAEGELEASKIQNVTDKQATIIKSQASAEAEKIRGEAEAEYMKILAEAYKTPEQQEFYSFYRSIEALKESMNGEKTIILSSDNELVKALMG